MAMLIHNSLSFNILVKGTDDLVIFVSLSCSSGKFCLGIFYRPPSSSVHIFDTLENVIFNLDYSFLSNLVLLGDFNVDFHPFSTHAMYSHLCSLIDNLSPMQVVGSNTHVDPNGSESLIDLVFVIPAGPHKVLCNTWSWKLRSLWNLSLTEELTPCSTCTVKQEQNHMEICPCRL